MASLSVHVEAASGDHGRLRGADKRPRHKHAQKVPSFWVRTIELAVQDARKTHCGQPTDAALLARWWIAEHRPARTDGVDWERSFEQACVMAGYKVAEMRKRLLAEIDAKWKRDNQKSVDAQLYVRRAMVLACAGQPTAISRQYLMPLVSEQDYEMIFDGEDLSESVMGLELAGTGAKLTASASSPHNKAA